MSCSNSRIEPSPRGIQPATQGSLEQHLDDNLDPVRNWIDVYELIPWTGRGKPRFVNDADYSRLHDQLERAGFDVVAFDGRDVRDDYALLTALGTALHFPSYYGVNWDAFDECFDDFAEARSRPVALVWRSSDVLAAADLRAFVRAAHIILSMMEQDLSLTSDGRLGRRALQMELLLTGQGPAYPRST